MFLGLSNPKAYAVFMSLFGSFTLIAADSVADTVVKWATCVAIIVIVDMVWLLAGVLLGRASLSDGMEQGINVLLATSIAIAAIFAFM